MEKTHKENGWTYIRIKLSTAKKLRQLKLNMDVEMYDDVLNAMLSKENLL